MVNLIRQWVFKAFVVLTCLATVPGCVTAWKRLDVPPSVDLSTSDSTAVISGSRSGINGLDCYISNPSRTRQLIVDAGDVSIRVECYSWGGEVGESMHTGKAEFAFQAEPDHAYELVGYSTCMGCGKRSRFGFEYVELVDQSDGKRFVLAAPFGYRVSDKHAIVSFRRPDPEDNLPCVYVGKESPPSEVIYIPKPPAIYYIKNERFESTRIDNGYLELHVMDQTISVQCTAPTGRYARHSAGGPITATFRGQLQLTAQPGRMYAVYMPDDGNRCLQVQDVFNKQVVVECSEAEVLE